ncbi:MAG: Fic family protein [Phycisphaerae bacterium]|nr:Fic family protein [Phycisphaerae bacterium]
MSSDRDRPPSGFEAEGGVIALPEASMRRLLGGHRPWRKLRHLAQEEGLDPLAAWRAVKAARWLVWRSLPLRRWEGGCFGVCLTPALGEGLFKVDRSSGDDLFRVGGAGASSSQLVERIRTLFSRGEVPRDRLRVATTMGEAAESSIMEGASATRAQAIGMLREGRAPASVGERMILNNHSGMELVKRSLGAELSLELLTELHVTLTEKTLEDPSACGRLRLPTEQVRVVDTRDRSTAFTPPPAEALPALLKDLFAFANGSAKGAGWIHPIVEASVLHFMIGYLHPFVDGNGRTARALFYWHALRHGYGLFEYLAISEVIRRGFARYPQAFTDSELDEGDLTYFVLYKLDVIEQSLARFAEYLAREEDRLARADALLALSRDLNLRQRLLLQHALRHPATVYTVKSHATSNGIVPATARADLDDLVRRRLMTTSKRGREVLYHVLPSLKDRVKRKGV